MIIFGKQSLVAVLLALSTIVGTFSVPIDDFDDEDMSEVHNADLLPLDHVPAEEILAPPNVEISVKTNPVSDDTTVAREEVGKADTSILGQFEVLEALGRVLAVDTEYIDNRKKEDPSWPETLVAKKVASKTATPEDYRTYKKDLDHYMSARVVMKLMEQRVASINKYFEQDLGTNPDTKQLLENINENTTLIQGLMEMKYFEGVLHSLNSMIDETDQVDTSYTPGVAVHNPKENDDDDDNDEEYNDDRIILGISELIFLSLAGVGFFLILVGILYLLSQGIQKCFEKSSEMNKKSKYEHI